MIINGDFERTYESLHNLRINQHLPRRVVENKNNFQVKLACFMAKIYNGISKYEFTYKNWWWHKSFEQKHAACTNLLY